MPQWASAVWCPSPYFNARPDMPVDLVVVHNISLPPGEFGGGHIEAFFQGTLDINQHPWTRENLQGVQVSAHFLINRDGQTTQFVDTADRAWHAGISQFQGRSQCNDFSIGIELEGTDHVAFEQAQYAELNRLIDWLRQQHPIQNVCGHSDIAPGRKTDPGPAFDWTRLEPKIGR